MRLSDAIRRIRARPPFGLIVALLIFALAFLMRFAVGDQLSNVPFITLFPAILVAAILGGIWVGLLVAVLSAVVAWFWFLPPSATTALHWPDGYMTWALFALTCAIQLYVVYALDKAVDELTLARDRSAALFQELQHRVANNLQFVASMLRLKRRALQLDPSAGERLFESAQSRLDTMARLHRRLYSPASLQLPVSEFLQGLCNDILESRGAQCVECTVAAAAVSFDLQRLVALGLLLNELVTNSVKHAFADRDSGTVAVSLQPDGSSHFVLTVMDNGRGLPPGLDLVETNSLGLRIINSLVVQLGGEMTWIEQQRGTAVRVVFPMGTASLPSTAAKDA
jgi:two-component system, sensor histidine kinase PdtaS